MNSTVAWSRGYPVDESYPTTWHGFLSPAHLRMICALKGVAWEVGPQTPLAIAELGCGTGYTSLVMAAGNPHWQVVGLDYNPAQIAEARSMGAAARLDNVQFIEADLADLDDRALERLPEFDLITVHGVWSWVSEPVREGVLRLLMRRLKPGGLAVVTYNALPGAAAGLGLARLIRPLLNRAGHSSAGRDAASAYVKRLSEAQAAHLGSSSWRRLVAGEVAGTRSDYIKHEFETEHWRPCFFADVAAAMAGVRCQYVGSATLDENYPQLSLTPAQRKLWDEAPDEATRELIFDFSVPRAFRRDLFVRGLRRVPRDAEVEGLWLASSSRSTADVVLKTQAGEAKLPATMIDAARKALNEGPRSLRYLHALPACGSASPSELLSVLCGSGCALPLWRHPGSGDDWQQACAAARRLNAVAAERLPANGAANGTLALATPALAGGLSASALDLVLARMLAEESGRPLATLNAATFAGRLLPPGASPEAFGELTALIATILSEQAPVWEALGIV